MKPSQPLTAPTTTTNTDCSSPARLYQKLPNEVRVMIWEYIAADNLIPRIYCGPWFSDPSAPSRRREHDPEFPWERPRQEMGRIGTLQPIPQSRMALLENEKNATTLTMDVECNIIYHNCYWNSCPALVGYLEAEAENFTHLTLHSGISRGKGGESIAEARAIRI
ncbi:hypothetical protein QBC38DRAFT_460109 [Podospora fimiseda]|uniref:Uncharacterized protein n=1 Tax=Podospora fimiseda TaxID=252190 RepID=A0AAN7BG05_9PEZI|nr:hypothetical protein QBC38DRAFT_460109 [Podospora fimiseda]